MYHVSYESHRIVATICVLMCRSPDGLLPFFLLLPPSSSFSLLLRYVGEVAEYERTGDGTPWSHTPHFEGCTEGAGRDITGIKGIKGIKGITGLPGKAQPKRSGNRTCTTVKEVVEESISTLGPLLDKYHVDIYAAGHEHSYSASWPIFNGASANHSLVDPKGTVYVVEGNGGVPGAHSHSKLFSCSRDVPHVPTRPPLSVFRMCGFGMNYGRLVTKNASVLTYEHVANADDRVMESWAIVRTH